MSLLDQDKVKMLEQEFKVDDRGLTLDSFVWLFLTVLTYPPEDKVDVINGTIKLFFDIDINGDGRLEWKEFNQYVIDQVATTQGLPAMIEEGQQCVTVEAEGRKILGDAEIIEKAYLQSIKNYVPRPKPDDALHFSRGIKKCLAMEGKFSSRLIFLEGDSNVLKIFDRKTLKFTEEIGLADIPTPIGCPGGLLGGTIAKEVKDFGISGLDDADSKFAKLQFGPNDLILPKREAPKKSNNANGREPKESEGSNIKTIILDFCRADIRKVVISLSPKILLLTNHRQLHVLDWENTKLEFVSILNLGVEVIQTRCWYMRATGQVVTAGQDHVLTIWNMDWKNFTRIEKYLIIDCHEDLVTSFYEVAEV